MLELLDKAIKEHNGAWGGRGGNILVTAGHLNVFFGVGEKFDFVYEEDYISGYWDYLCTKEQYLERAKELGYNPPTELKVLIDEALKEMGYYVDEMGYYKTPGEATYAAVKQMIELGYRKEAK